MAEQRFFSAGFRCPPRVFPRHDLSRAPRMSSPTTTYTAPKTVAKGLRPSADTNAHPQGTSSPVSSSTLRAVSGSGSDRTHELRPDAPVSPRALLGDPRGPPARLRYLQPVWAGMEPTLQAQIDSISIQDVEASHALTGTAADGDEPALKAADACALSVVEEEHALAMQPLQARAAALDCEHANLWGRLRHLETERRSNAAEMATAERHHQTFTSNIEASPRQPLPARAATRPAAPATSVTFSAPTAPQWRHTADPEPQQHQAPTTAAGFTAPTAAPVAGNTMLPPPPQAARVPFTTAAPWSVVAARRPWQPPLTPRNDRYLDLRVSRLMFVNMFLPADTRKPVKELASHVDAAFRTLDMDRCLLRLALKNATQDGTPLCDYLVDDILRLRDLLERAYATPAGDEWVREALSQAAASRRPVRTTSSGSDTSSSAGPRRRDEPSSGRGNSKRATLTETSDSDDRQPRHQGRHHQDKRQVTAHIVHATKDDNDAPPFPPRVFRYRTRSRRPHPRVAALRADHTALVTDDPLLYSTSLKKLPPRLSLP